MPRLHSIIEYRFVTPSMLAAGVDEEGRPVEVAEPLSPQTLEGMAERQCHLVVALAIEVEMHRDTGVHLSEMFHGALDFESCDCQRRLEHARRKTRTEERTILAKVWLVGRPDKDEDQEMRP